MIIKDYTMGTVFTNQDLMDTFKVSNSGGMRRSKAANTLILVNKTDSIYKNYWQDDIFYYTGMGLTGDQNLNSAQNKTLSESNHNGITILLFNHLKPNHYVYAGQVYLAAKPFYQEQKDKDNKSRKVVIFPLKLKQPPA